MNTIVELHYDAVITLEFDSSGLNEGEILDKAREIAEETDCRQFSFARETSARIINR